MSNIINKIKEAVTGEPHTTTTHTTTTGHNTTGAYDATGPTAATGGTAEGVSGPHSSRIANAMDPRVDSDRDGSARVGGTTTGMTGNTYGSGTTGTTTGTAEGMTGPHSSRLANALDPRVDSDMDGSSRVGAGATTAGVGTAAGAHHHHHHHHHTTENTGMTGTTTGTAEGVSGPHSSRLANAMDPRVDSDRDGSARVGGTNTGVGNTYGTGATGTTTGTTAGGVGPHSSSLLNKLDPRVDSTTGLMKGSTTGTTGTTGNYGNTSTTGNYGNTSTTGNYGNTSNYANTGTTGGLSSSTNAGPHDSNLANKLDPRVDSDLDHRGNRHGAATGGVFGASGSHATPGQGTAQNTAGPHNSDLMNKLDPRVDSDMDGSATMGGNRTHTGTGTGRDPTDAAHVPPSVLREHLGEPQIAHDNPENNFSGRHGSVVSDHGPHV